MVYWLTSCLTSLPSFQLASKTMIEILPPNLAAHVEKKCGSLAGQHITLKTIE